MYSLEGFIQRYLYEVLASLTIILSFTIKHRQNVIISPSETVYFVFWDFLGLVGFVCLQNLIW